MLVGPRPILDKASPATIQRVKALELSKRRSSPPGHFTMSLFCSCAWPIDLSDGLDPTCLHVTDGGAIEGNDRVKLSWSQWLCVFICFIIMLSADYLNYRLSNQQ